MLLESTGVARFAAETSFQSDRAATAASRVSHALARLMEEGQPTLQHGSERWLSGPVRGQHRGRLRPGSRAVGAPVGIPVVADLERLSGPEVLELARQVDHLIVGTGFAGHVTGESEPAAMVRALRRPGQTAVSSQPGKAAVGTRRSKPATRCATCPPAGYRPWTPPAAATCSTARMPRASRGARAWRGR